MTVADICVYGNQVNGYLFAIAIVAGFLFSIGMGNLLAKQGKLSLRLWLVTLISVSVLLVVIVTVVQQHSPQVC